MMKEAKKIKPMKIKIRQMKMKMKKEWESPVSKGRKYQVKSPQRWGTFERYRIVADEDEPKGV